MSRLIAMTHRALLTLTLTAPVSGIPTTLVSAATTAPAPAPAAPVAAPALIQQGFNQGDPALLRKARGQLLGQLTADPASASLHTWVAVVAWRAVPLLARTDKNAARRICEEGLEHAEAALSSPPDMALALALKAALQGLSIQFNGAAAMTLGPAMVENMARAADMAPADPRIQLLDGINTLHTPSIFGGGPERALAKFRRALELFATEAPDSSGARWGRDDAHVWAGRAEAKRENFAAARRHYVDALAINPNHGWVKNTLLPEVDATLASKEKSGS